MLDWDAGERFGEMFGKHYDFYKYYIRKMYEYRDLQNQIFREVKRNVHGRIGGTIKEIKESYRKLFQNLDTKNYSWDGPAYRACTNRVAELLNNIKKMDRAQEDAADALIERLRQEERRCRELAQQEADQFNIYDKVTQAVDEGARDLKEQIKRAISSL